MPRCLEPPVLCEEQGCAVVGSTGNGGLLLAALEVSHAPHKVLGVPLVLTFLGPAGCAGLPFQQTSVHRPPGFSHPPCLTSPSSIFGRLALSPVLCSSKNRMASLFPITMVHLEGTGVILESESSICSPCLAASGVFSFPGLSRFLLAH